MAVKLAQINLTNLPAGWTVEPGAFRGNRSANGGIEPEIAVRCVPRVPDTDDALGFTGGLGRNGVAGSFLEHVEASFVGAHVRIMRTCDHRSSCRYVRSAPRTFARYALGMAKTRVRKPNRKCASTNRLEWYE
jgi:hypothetical protein